MIPLYSTDHKIPNDFEISFNTGLWYDKFCNTWIKDQGKWSLQVKDKKAPKADWINTLAGKKTGDLKFIKEMVTRRAALVSAMGGKLRVFTTLWRFITGLGKEHPVENGFAWHPTLGTAYLPGSSVKGMIRAWAWEYEGVEKNILDRVFGPETGDSKVGSIIFFDAIPLSTVLLQADIMTPHYSSYYQDGNNPPGDWNGPEPIQFLTVAPGQDFLFTLAPRYLEQDRFIEDMELALYWLERALEWAGAGAKTSVGYGRFKRRYDKEKKQQEELEEERKQQNIMENMSPLRREMEEDGYSSAEFMDILTNKWLPRMEAEDTAEEERVEIARLLMDWYQKYNSDQWKKPNKKNKKKINRIKQVLENN